MGPLRTPLLSILMLALAGCSPRGGTRGPVLHYETRTLSRSFGACDTAGTPCVSIRFSYPAILNVGAAAGAESVGTYVRTEMFTSLEDAGRTLSFDSIASDLIDQYTSLRAEFADYSLPWTLERLCTVPVDTSGVISIRFEETSFLGGAHGLRIVRLASFDTYSGKRLSCEDFFGPGYESAFARIVEQEFRMARSIPDSQSLADAGFWIEEGKFEPTENVAIGRGALVLYYNPYEIAPYVMGPTEVRIPFAHLNGIVRRGGPLWKIERGEDQSSR